MEWHDIRVSNPAASPITTRVCGPPGPMKLALTILAAVYGIGLGLGVLLSSRTRSSTCLRPNAPLPQLRFLKPPLLLVCVGDGSSKGITQRLLVEKSSHCTLSAASAGPIWQCGFHQCKREEDVRLPTKRHFHIPHSTDHARQVAYVCCVSAPPAKTGSARLIQLQLHETRT